MNKTILGRCEKCDRIVWEDEGARTIKCMAIWGKCLQCRTEWEDAQLSKDYEEMDKDIYAALIVKGRGI